MTPDAAEAVERSDVEEGVRRGAGERESFVLSAGEAGTRLPFTDGDGLALLLDGGRDRTTRGVDVTVVFTLAVEMVDVEDKRRDRDAELAGISDFAVANVVEPPSLVEDRVDEGLLAAETGLRVEGPATVFRSVDARD